MSMEDKWSDVNESPSPPMLSPANTHVPEFQAEIENDNLRLRLRFQEMKLQQIDKEIELERLRQGRVRDIERCESMSTRVADCRLSLPKLEIPRFGGDPSRYWIFMRSFVANVEHQVHDDVTRLSYLIQYCDGEAKELIEDCAVMEPAKGYQAAKDILTKRYGQNFMIAKAHIDKIINGPVIKENDPVGLMKLVQQMGTCEIILNQIHYQSSLNSDSTIEFIVRRLPNHLQYKWAEVARLANKNGREATFKDLTEFLAERAEIANTKYGIIASEAAAPAHDVGISRFKGEKSKNAIGKGMVHISQGHISDSQAPRYTPKCPVCSGQHFTDQCQKFLGASPTERREIVTECKLCNICLKPNHIAKDCRMRRFCTAEGCGKPHHRLLHSDTHLPSALSANGANGAVFTTVGSQVEHQRSVSLGVLPVIVKANGKKYKTCALLDSGADCSLMKKSLGERLGLKGRQISLSIGTLGNTLRGCSEEVKIELESVDSKTCLQISAWTVEELPKIKRMVPTMKQIQKWQHLEGLPFAEVSTCDIDILIGLDVPLAHRILEQRCGKENEPFANLTPFGWVFLGPLSTSECSEHANCLVTNRQLSEQLETMYKREFDELKNDDEIGMSLDDRRALDVMKGSITLKDGHYEIALPWKHDPPRCSESRSVAVKRLHLLGRRFRKYPKLAAMYTETVNKYIREGHAECIDVGSESETLWYLPHHPVLHPLKPDKVRVVFDCASKYAGTSLNDMLLQGPDLTNNLTGVLLRFRQGPVAVVADIEAMFHQVRLVEKDRDAMRFLWWKEGDVNSEPVEMRMCVHVFGATSSPSCAAFALQTTIEANQNLCHASVIATAKRCFYVDDCLASFGTVEEASRFVNQIKMVLAKGGFNLTKWLCTVPEVVEKLIEEDYSKSQITMNSEGNDIQRTLGVDWDFRKDEFRFHVNFREILMTRREILSYVASLFDPMGFVAPILLPAKLLLQRLCKRRFGWDDEIPDEEKIIWNKWILSLKELPNVSVRRCCRPSNFNALSSVQIHIFSDASEDAYGTVAYLRLVDVSDRVHCCLLLGKSRVGPTKCTTIPRMELVAATLAVKVYTMLRRELDYEFETVFWSDSMIVLQSIRNTVKRFRTFVANRLAVIHQHSQPEQWKFIDTKQNPADLASRGFFASEHQKMNVWFNGPKFLWKTNPVPDCLKDDTSTPIPDEFLKPAPAVACMVNSCPAFIDMFSHITSWMKLLKTIAWLSRFKLYIVSKFRGKHFTQVSSLSVSELKCATEDIIRLVQGSAFKREIELIANSRSLTDTSIESCSNGSIDDRQSLRKRITGLRSIGSPVRKLNPFLLNGIMRVGGRLQMASVPFETKHPVILPSRHFVTELIIKHYHIDNGHIGIAQVSTYVRQRYWILKSSSTIKRVIAGCFKCRRWFSGPCKQAMAPLPQDRVTEASRPFTIVGLDLFGPLYVKVGRRIEKRYGCIFTCLTMRAVHIEMVHSADTNSFLCAFSRFIARRGCPERVYSDNGQNFKGAEVDVKEIMLKWNHELIADRMLQRGCDWIFNAPKASHRGGIWERIIRSIRRILKVMLEEQSVSDEVLHTTLTEVERILNDRPLVKQTDDPEDSYALTPNKLLLLCGCTDISSEPDIVENRLNRRWKQVQYLANVFWNKWLKCYLPTLNETQRWLNVERNLKVGDLVLLLDLNSPRGQWPKAVVEDVKLSSDGLVREVMVRTSTGSLRRDVRQVCLLEENVIRSECSDQNAQPGGV